MNDKEYLIKILGFIILFFIILMLCVTALLITTITNL
uniref:Type VI secretion protein n=1 Tax=Podoviridae sp. ctUm43 TaxID=2827738 RepID=A0A8S5SWM8_9CAUD|nr:MAG TPA: type VI secretion protein [Podoviridae sp. ctUm43]